MYKAIAEIKEAFEKANLNFDVDQNGERWFITLTMKGDASQYRFLFIKSDDEGNDVAVRLFNLLEVPQANREKMVTMINICNQVNEFAKFALDDDDTVTVSYDFAVSFSPIGQGALWILSKLCDEIDEAYPRLLAVAAE